MNVYEQMIGPFPSGIWCYGAGGQFTDLAGEIWPNVAKSFTDETLKDIPVGEPFIATVGEGRLRRDLAERGRAHGLELTNYRSRHAIVAHNIELPPGSILMGGCVLMGGVKLGEGALVNIGAMIGHDCTLGAWSSVQPGANLTGYVEVGEEAYIGIGATLICRDKTKPLRIGRGAIVGGGAVVFRDVPAGETWIGNPARCIRAADGSRKHVTRYGGHGMWHK